MTLAIIGGSGAHALLKEHADEFVRREPLGLPSGSPAGVRGAAGRRAFPLPPPTRRTRIPDRRSLGELPGEYLHHEGTCVTRMLSWSGPGAIDPQLRIGGSCSPTT